MKDQLDKRSCREQKKQGKAVAQLNADKHRKAPETAMGTCSSLRSPCEEGVGCSPVGWRKMDSFFPEGKASLKNKKYLEHKKCIW